MLTKAQVSQLHGRRIMIEDALGALDEATRVTALVAAVEKAEWADNELERLSNLLGRLPSSRLRSRR